MPMGRTWHSASAFFRLTWQQRSGVSPRQEALNAVTLIHANAVYAGKVMAMTKAKHNVAYHFQNDADTLPVVMNAVQSVYDGPVDYAQDLMVWNVTKKGVQTRMAVPNREAYPPPRAPREEGGIWW